MCFHPRPSQRRGSSTLTNDVPNGLFSGLTSSGTFDSIIVHSTTTTIHSMTGCYYDYYRHYDGDCSCHSVFLFALFSLFLFHDDGQCRLVKQAPIFFLFLSSLPKICNYLALRASRLSASLFVPRWHTMFV